jgi:LuxR family transcriptional regulator, maltose regulon positive regulatory protein
MSARQKTSAMGNWPLLHNKLMAPRLNSNVIHRDDLLSRLDQALNRKLTLVTAPTGFGKTTLVSMWTANRQFASAWVTLDQNDNDSTRFWTYVVSALRSLHSSMGKTTLSTLTTSQPLSFQTLLTPLINDLTRLRETTVLVLEDFHFITSKEIMDGVSFLIQHLPDALHLILITRTEPDLHLPLLRVRDEMMEIVAADLRFDQDEVKSFLSLATQTNFSALEIRQLLQKTEGWVAGLRLVALSLHNKGGSAEIEKLINSFSGHDRYVTDYLIEEVFKNQPESIQAFLLKTCFFNRLTGSLCDSIIDSNNSSATLEKLERDNLFLVQLEHPQDQTWYRYNPMFAESIQYLARQRLGEPGIQVLFEKASNWYEYHGLFGEAVDTALTAKLFDRAIMLIEKFIGIHDLSEMNTLERWLEKIPQQTILSHPLICFTYAQVILYSADRFAPATAIRIEPFLNAAESAWRATKEYESIGQLLSFRGNVQWWQGNFLKAFQYANQSLAELPEHNVFWRGNSLLIISYEALQAGRIRHAQNYVLEARALLGAAQNIFGVLAATQMLSEIFYWQGDLQQAEQLNQQTLTDAVGDDSMLDDQGIASLSLAHIAYERNDLDQAQQQAQRALKLGEQRANELLQMQATIRLANIHAANENAALGRELLKSLEAKIQNSVLLREIQNTQALFSIRANDSSSLEWWVKMISVENKTVLQLQKEREAFTLARLQIADGLIDEAINLLKGWHEDAAENGRVRSQVEVLCLEALAYHADSNEGKATQLLSEALAIGHAKGFRRIFLDEGTRIAALLQAVLSRLPDRPLSLFASALLHSFSAESTSYLAANSTVQIEPLSPQELRVLRLLVAGSSNADIAQELFVSTNTIKSHIKSIYRKLNVNSRNEARELARELKLL